MPDGQTPQKRPLALTLCLLRVILPKCSVSYLFLTHSLTKLSRYWLLLAVAWEVAKRAWSSSGWKCYPLFPECQHLDSYLQPWLARAILVFGRKQNPCLHEALCLVGTDSALRAIFQTQVLHRYGQGPAQAQGRTTACGSNSGSHHPHESREAGAWTALGSALQHKAGGNWR